MKFDRREFLGVAGLAVVGGSAVSDEKRISAGIIGPARFASVWASVDSSRQAHQDRQAAWH